MGNKLTKDFKEMKLGRGHMTAASATRSAIVPDAVVLDSAISIAVQKDSKSKSLKFVDTSTQNCLFTTTLTKSDSMGSITKDAKGHVLFITKAPNKETRIIFKASESFNKDVPESEPSSIAEDDDELSPVAKIDVDFVASTINAFLSVKYKKRSGSRGDGSAESGSYQSIDSASKTSKTTQSIDSATRKSKASQSAATTNEPTYLDVYKAVKIDGIKFGSFIVDMRGQVVGKSEQGKKDPYPLVHVAIGADASAVVALACIVNFEL